MGIKSEKNNERAANTRRVVRASWVLLAALALLVAACEKDAPAPEQHEAEASAPTQAAPTPDEDLNADRYELVGPRAPVSVGEASDVTLSIKAADGLEINHEFPWSIEFSDADELELEQTTFAGGALQLGERSAEIPLKMAPNSPGEHTLEAVGNFSVCNDTQCYVIRDQKLAFNIEVAEADEQSAQ